MAKFPIQEARPELGFTPSTAVRANIDTRTGAGAVGVAIGEAGLAVAGELQKRSARREAIDQKNRDNLDVLSAKRADERRKQTAVEIENMKLNNPPEEWEERTAQIVTTGNTEISGFDFSPNELAKQQISSNGDLIELPAAELANATRVISKATIVTAEESLTDAYRLGREDLAQRNIDFIATLKNNGVSAGAIALRRKAAEEAGTNLRKADAIENIKPALVEAIETVDKEEAIKTLDLATKILTDSDILSETEAAQANKVLGDWVDNYVAGRKKRAEEAAKLTTVESYQRLLPIILDDEQAQNRFEAVERSNLLKADKDKWKTYVKGSYKDAPIENSPSGFKEVVGAILDMSSLQLSPKETYDALLTERYINNSITNAQFEWGVDKINNPYQKSILEDLRSTLNGNANNFRGLFNRNGKERNKVVNESLIAWVDDLIEKDKVPLFDFKKKMHAMSSQFRVGSDRWYDIGQIIKRGGRNWEITGFDENGEPMVDEVP